MNDLVQLKGLIDEENYPFYTDEYLTIKLAEGKPITALARELCLQKAGIPEVKLGDVTIPSPKEYFLNKASMLRTNLSGTVVRIDGQ